MTTAAGTALARRLAGAVPFYYGWVILACVCLAGLSRAGPAVATLSIFVEPMTREFGWSRAALAGAVSVGGVLAAVGSPLIGSYLDRHGARVVLGLAVLATGGTLMLLAAIDTIVAFYLLYCVARMCWAGPYDLGIYGALNTWFVARRATAASIATFAQTAGLVGMPLVAYAVMTAHGWRTAWLAVGGLVLLLGFLPAWLLLIRRPEDAGLVPDGEAPPAVAGTAAQVAHSPQEPAFTRGEALRTRAFWALALFTVLIFPVQAGLSLHLAAHLIESGLTPAAAATAVSAFTAASALTGFGAGVLLRRTGVRLALALSGVTLAAAALAMMSAATPERGIAAAVLFGLGIGGVHVVLPVAWADYFGRRSFGAIRGVALSVQVAAQAAGPLLSGVLRDHTGDYRASLIAFAVLAFTGMLAAIGARAPSR
jgi:MFS family permease